MESSLSSANSWLASSPTLDSEIAGGITRGAAPILQGSSRRVIMDGFTFCMDGAIAADGSVLAGASAEGGDDPAIRILGRPEATATTASLAGTYHLIGFSYQQSPQATIASLGKVVLEGLGGGTVLLSTNTDGTIAGPSGPLPASFEVTVNGLATLSFSPAEFSGAVMAGGDLVVLGGDTTTNTPARALLILIRESSAATTATFAGRYVSVAFARASTFGWDADRQTRTADGAGTYTQVEGFRNADGQIWEIPSTATAPYSLSGDGSLAFGIQGAVTPDGRFAALVQMTATLRPRIHFLVRVSP